MSATGRTIRGTRSWRNVITALASAACASALALLAAKDARVAIAAAVLVFVVGIIAVNPMILVGAAIPATLIVARIGGGTSNISVSDFVLFFATVIALPYVKLREAPLIARLLVADVVYELALLPTVLYNPYRANFVEWAHELVMVSGSIVVGWAIGRKGYARSSLSIYLFGASIIGVFACIQAVKSHFQPAYLPFGMQKNYIGIMMMFAIIIILANVSWATWSTTTRRTVLSISVLGLLACQSHQAMIGTFSGGVVIYLRNRQLGKRSRIMVASLVPLVIIAYESITREFASNNQFNSVHQRLSWYSDSLQVFHVSPWFGVGLRWWYTTRFSFNFQPPNAEIEMLSSAGLVGLAAFVYLVSRYLYSAWRMPAAFGTLALAVLVARVLDGQFDIFWVGATIALPFLVLGVTIGACTRSEEDPTGPDPRPVHMNAPG